MVYPLSLVFPLNPPPVWVPLNLAPCLVHDGQVLDQLKCLYGCGFEAPLALEVRACHMGRVAVGCRAVRRAQVLGQRPGHLNR